MGEGDLSNAGLARHEEVEGAAAPDFSGGVPAIAPGCTSVAAVPAAFADAAAAAAAGWAVGHHQKDGELAPHNALQKPERLRSSNREGKPRRERKKTVVSFNGGAALARSEPKSTLCPSMREGNPPM